MLLLDGLQLLGDQGQRLAPRRRRQLAILAHERHGKPALVVDPRWRSAPVADPLVVDVHVLAADDAAQLCVRASMRRLQPMEHCVQMLGVRLDLPRAVGEAGNTRLVSVPTGHTCR